MALIAGNLLSENHQSIETSVGDWASYAPGASAVIQSTEQAHDGTNSIKSTSNGTGGELCSLTSTGSAPVVSAGVGYTFTLWAYTTDTNAVIQPNVDWYASNNSTFVDFTAGTNVALTASTWTQVGTADTFTSPAGAGVARIYINHVSGLVSGNVAYIDEVFFGVPVAPVGPNPMGRMVIA